MHIDNIDDQGTQRLLDSLAAFNITQHVRVLTHSKGHTLDVIITRTEDEPFQPTNAIARPIHFRPQAHNTRNLRN